eukprot:gene16139-biopygen6738
MRGGGSPAPGAAPCAAAGGAAERAGATRAALMGQVVAYVSTLNVDGLQEVLSFVEPLARPRRRRGRRGGVRRSRGAVERVDEVGSAGEVEERDPKAFRRYTLAQLYSLRSTSNVSVPLEGEWVSNLASPAVAAWADGRRI